MKAGKHNHRKNTNTAREAVCQRLAQSFAKDGVRPISTLYVLSPSKQRITSPLEYVQATITAVNSTLLVPKSKDKVYVGGYGNVRPGAFG